MTEAWREAWREWITRQVDRKGWTYAETARRAGLPRSAISNYCGKGSEPSIENCRGLAAAFGTSLLRVLVAAGHLSESEARVRPNAEGESPAALSDAELLAELRRRLARPEDKSARYVDSYPAADAPVTKLRRRPGRGRRAAEEQ